MDVKKEKIEKYYKALSDLHTTLQHTSSLSMTDFVKKKKLSKRFTTIINNGGIVKCKSRGPNPQWKWNTIKPNKQMALELYKKIMVYHKRLNTDKPRLKGIIETAKTHGAIVTKNKYQVEIKGVKADVYDVLKAFDITCPATQHAIKKLLKAGKRGYKDAEQDLDEAISSINRAKELQND